MLATSVDEHVRATLFAEADRNARLKRQATPASPQRPIPADLPPAETAQPAAKPAATATATATATTEEDSDQLMLRWLTLSYLHDTAGHSNSRIAAEVARRSLDVKRPPPSDDRSADPIEWYRKEVYTPFGIKAPLRDHAKWRDSYAFAASMYERRLIRGKPEVRTIPWREHGWSTGPEPKASVLARMVTQHQASCVIASHWRRHAIRRTYVSVLLPEFRVKARAARVIQNWWFWRRHVVRRKTRELKRRQRSAFGFGEAPRKVKLPSPRAASPATLAKAAGALRPTAAPWLEPRADRGLGSNVERVRAIRARASAAQAAQALQQERYAQALEQSRENRAAAALQARLRGWRSRAATRALRLLLKERFPTGGYNEAAAKIQAHVRGWRQRRAYCSLREALLEERLAAERAARAALLLTRAVRGMLGRARAARMRLAAEAEARRRARAATLIAAALRTWRERRLRRRAEAERAAADAMTHIAAEAWRRIVAMESAPLLELLERRHRRGDAAEGADELLHELRKDASTPDFEVSTTPRAESISNVNGALAYLRSLRVKQYTTASPRAAATAPGFASWECRLCFAQNAARASHCRVCSRVRGAPPMCDLAVAAARRHVSSKGAAEAAEVAFAEARLTTRHAEALAPGPSRRHAWLSDDAAATVVQRIWRGGRVRAVVFDWALAAQKARDRARRSKKRAEALECAHDAIAVMLRACFKAVRQAGAAERRYGSWFASSAGHLPSPHRKAATAKAAKAPPAPAPQGGAEDGEPPLCEACARLHSRRQCASCARQVGGASIRLAPPAALGGTLFAHWLREESTLPAPERRVLLARVRRVQLNRAAACVAAWRRAARRQSRARGAANAGELRRVRRAFGGWWALVALAKHRQAADVLATASKTMAEAAAKARVIEERRRRTGTLLSPNATEAMVNLPGGGVGTLIQAHEAARNAIDGASEFQSSETLDALDHVALALFTGGGATDGDGGASTPRGGGGASIEWYYRDDSGARQGPYNGAVMLRWWRAGYLTPTLPVCGVGVGSRYGPLAATLVDDESSFMSLREALRRALKAHVVAGGAAVADVPARAAAEGPGLEPRAPRRVFTRSGRKVVAAA